jgi:RNA polymerase sigma factor (sigma-70 family)
MMVCMFEQGDDLEQRICNAANRAIQRYAQGILSVEVLAGRMMQEWEERRSGDDVPSQELLTRLAQRICSRELYAAWCSPEQEHRDRAFENLRRYLGSSLRQISFAKALELCPSQIEDVVQHTLSALVLALNRNPPAGPGDPAAFLKWTQTILIRTVYACLQKARSEPCLSLEAQPQNFVEQLIDNRNEDPQEQLLQKELQHTLKNAILSLRNPRYRQVLICTYLVGMDESELASYMQVEVQDVYLWRHRAIKALRSRPEVMQALRPWLR